jgi:hypothetical protein
VLLPVTEKEVPVTAVALKNASLVGPGTVTDPLSVITPDAALFPSTAIRYTAPLVTGNESELVITPLDALSFEATAVKAPTLEPWYTAKTVSNPEPVVERLHVPVLVAVQDHQTDLAGALPAC